MGPNVTFKKGRNKGGFPMKRTGKYAKCLLGVLLLLAFTACASSESTRSTGTYVDDKVIASKVKTELITNEETKARNIEVEVYQGVVQLSGFVETERSKKMAGDIARRVEGVVDVKNDLIVRK
jgi:osmotically-inducible protein OsmY